MATLHMQGWRGTEATVVGFYSKGDANATLLADRFKITRYASVDALLKDVDIIDICTPTDTHHELVLQSAAAGAAILCEKPLARTVAQAEAMLDICARNSVRIMVAHVLRFFPQYRHAASVIKGGEYGSPAVLRFYRHCFSPESAHENWFLRRERSGGVILDLMLHDIDIALWSAGPVRRASAAYSARSGNSAQNEHAVAILEHTNGALSHLEGSWAFPPPTFRMGFEIAFSNHLLTYDSLESEAATYHIYNQLSEGSEGGVPQPSSSAPYIEEIATFYEAIRDNHPFPFDAREGLEALRVAHALTKAAERGTIETVANGERRASRASKDGSARA